MAELTQEGRTVLLEQWLADLDTSYQILLYRDTISPNNGFTYTDFIAGEVNTGAYARTALAPGGWTITDNNATYPTVQFTAGSGGFGTVRGYCCVTTEASPRSVFFETGTDILVGEGGRYGVNLSEVVP